MVLCSYSCSSTNNNKRSKETSFEDEVQETIELVEILSKIKNLVDNNDKSGLKKLCKDKNISMKARLFACGMAYTSAKGFENYDQAIKNFNELEDIDLTFFNKNALGLRAQAYSQSKQKEKAFRDANKLVQIAKIEAEDLFEIFKKHNFDNKLTMDRKTWEKIQSNNLKGFNKEQQEIVRKIRYFLPEWEQEAKGAVSNALIIRADLFIQSNDYESALLDYEEAITYTPSDQRLYENIDNLKLKISAGENFKKTNFKQNVNSAQSNISFGNNPSGKENNAVAIRLFREGLDAFNTNDLNLAISKLSESIKFSKRTGAFLFRGQAYQAQNKYHEAMSDYDAEITNRPTFIAFYYRGILKHTIGNTEAAIQDMNKCLALQADSASCMAYKGFYKTAFGNETKNRNLIFSGIKDLDKALEIDPNYATAYHFRAFARDLAYLQSFDSSYLLGAAEDIEKALSIEPKNQNFKTTYDFIARTIQAAQELAKTQH